MVSKTVVKATKAVRDLKKLSLVPRSTDGVAPAGVPVPGLGNVDVAIVDVGPSSGTLDFTITNFSFSTLTPFVILLQPRQNHFTDNQNNGFPDEFATQVIATGFDDATSSNFIEVLITRVDPDNEGQGWGQDLELDIFVIE
jgi:hypothetical protein